MVPLFLGLTAANLIVLGITFAVGLGAIDAGGEPTRAYDVHLPLGFGAGLLVLLTHISVYTYFMATTKWLAAATDKGNLDRARFIVEPARRKRRAFVMSMSAIGLVMIAMFAGAGADSTMARPLWPGEVHLALGALALAGNAFVALGQYRVIRLQGRTMDEALGVLNADNPLPLGEGGGEAAG
jgi:phosphatidylglycerophosphate synthase